MAVEKTPVRTGDQETDEILNQMETDGTELPAGLKPKSQQRDDSRDEEEETDTEDESEEGADEEDEDEGASDDSADSNDEDESDDESEDGDDDDDDSVGSHANDNRSSAPRGEYFRLERQIGKLTKAVGQILQGRGTAEDKKVDVDAEVEQFAKLNGLKPEATKGLIDLIAKKLGSTSTLTDEERDALRQNVQVQKERQFWDSQDQAYDADFRQNVLPFVRQENPNITEAELERLYDDLKDLAFDPKNAQRRNSRTGEYAGTPQKSLVEIYLGTTQSRRKPSDRRTLEGGSPNRVTQGDVSDEDVTAEDIAAMSDEEFDKYSDRMGKNAKSTIRHL